MVTEVVIHIPTSTVVRVVAGFIIAKYFLKDTNLA